MLTRIRIVLLAAFAAACTSSPAVAALKYPGCGGFPLPYGTTIGGVGPSTTKFRASSVMAVAAVTRVNDDDSRAQAWMVWDERGFAWLAIARHSPSDLRRLWVFSVPLNFNGPGNQVRFTALKQPLPKTYRLVDCPDAGAYRGT